MRTISLIAVTCVPLSLSTIGARADGTWCAQYGGMQGGKNCGFYSFEQCQAARSGNGGFCSPSSSAYGSASSAYGSAAQPRKRHRRDY